jgi:hypothetical protein
MPCKIQIRKNLKEGLEEKAGSFAHLNFEDASKAADNLNKIMGERLLYFTMNGDFMDSWFNEPSDRLVQIYYDYELKLEQEEAAKNKVDTPSSDIKPGVEELFDSNPELANQVYEALGLKPQEGKTRLWRVGNKEDDAASYWTTNSKDLEFYLKSENQGNPTIYYVDVTADELNQAKISGKGIGEEEYLFIEEKGNKLTQERIKQITPQQKQQALQLYSQYLESLNKPNTNPILQGNQTNIEEIITHLEKDKLLEIDCKGKLKAEKGLATSFTKGGKWKVIKDLKGYPTHKKGGVDLTIGKDGVKIKNSNTEFTAKHGLVIPKN